MGWFDDIVDGIADVATSAWDAAKNIPVLGTIVQAVGGAITAPFELAAKIASGARIDTAALDFFKGQVAIAKSIGPYAQAVISFIPGAGTLVSGAIGVGLALAEGKPVSDAVIAGVRGAIPGGPLATAAFDVGVGLMQGKPIEQLGIAALPIPEQMKRFLASSAEATRRIVEGRPVDEALMRQIIENSPPEIREKLKQAASTGPIAFAEQALNYATSVIPVDDIAALNNALKTGIAMGKAQALQRDIEHNLEELPQFDPGTVQKALAFSQASMSRLATEKQQEYRGSVAKAALKTANDFALTIRPKTLGEQAATTVIGMGASRTVASPIIHSAYKLASPKSKIGFIIGAGLTGFKGTSPFELITARKGLNGENKKGFDMAVALQGGIASTPANPAVTDPTVAAGYLITNGVKAAEQYQKSAIIGQLGTNRVAKVGAIAAAKKIVDRDKGFLTRVLEWLGLA